MKAFVDLVVPQVRIKGIHTRDEFLEAERESEQRAHEFTHLVGESNLRLWAPGEPVSSGERILCGVSTACTYDLYLLDQLDGALRDGSIDATIDVFDIDLIGQMDDFEQYIPGIGPVYQSPAVGVWVDGILRERGTGFAARYLVRERLGLSDPRGD